MCLKSGVIIYDFLESTRYSVQPSTISAYCVCLCVDRLLLGVVMESLPRLLACGHRSLGWPEGVYIKLNISGLISSSIYRTLDSELETSARYNTVCEAWKLTRKAYLLYRGRLKAATKI